MQERKNVLSVTFIKTVEKKVSHTSHVFHCFGIGSSEYVKLGYFIFEPPGHCAKSRLFSGNTIDNNKIFRYMNMTKRGSKLPYIIGVAGGSGSGKVCFTFLNAL